MYRNAIYSKVEEILLIKDTLTLKFVWWKSIMLSTEKKIGDWDIYLDFSIIELYKNEILSEWRIDDIEIKIVEWEWILIYIWKSKVFIPWYHNHIYYTSDMVLVVTYIDWENTKIDKFDMEKWVFNFY